MKMKTMVLTLKKQNDDFSHAIFNFWLGKFLITISGFHHAQRNGEIKRVVEIDRFCSLLDPKTVTKRQETLTNGCVEFFDTPCGKIKAEMIGNRLFLKIPIQSVKL